MPKAGWTLETVKGKYDKPYDYFGTPTSEGVKEVVWSGGRLPDDQYDEFVFRAYLSNDLKPETMLYVPVVQECEGGGVERWIEIPAAGKVADDYKFPAPASSCFPRSEPTKIHMAWMAGHRVRPFSAVALNAVRVILLVAFTWFGAGAAATGAAAHASLVMTSPAEGAVLQAAPQEFSLTFSEPVSPLSLNLIGPDGSKRALSGFTLKDKTLAITAPPALARGTHVLSWRVVSEDGHPVGGSVVFSSGEPSATRLRSRPAPIARS